MVWNGKINDVFFIGKSNLVISTSNIPFYCFPPERAAQCFSKS